MKSFQVLKKKSSTSLGSAAAFKQNLVEKRKEWSRDIDNLDRKWLSNLFDKKERTRESKIEGIEGSPINFYPSILNGK